MVTRKGSTEESLGREQSWGGVQFAFISCSSLARWWLPVPGRGSNRSSYPKVLVVEAISFLGGRRYSPSAPHSPPLLPSLASGLGVASVPALLGVRGWLGEGDLLEEERGR